MTRIADILLRARDTLADPNKERWSDPRLIRLIDEGQRDIAKHTRVLKSETTVTPLDGIATYQLPDDVWLLTRAAFQDCVIPFNSHEEMDSLVRTQQLSSTYPDVYSSYGSTVSDFSLVDYCWEAETGTEIAALIYDRRMPNTIKMFPIPTGAAFDVADNLGLATSIDGHEFNSVYGVVTDVQGSEVKPIFGVTVAGEQFTGTVRLWYIQMPDALVDENSTLQLPSMWDVALKHYVIANAFDDDYDEKSLGKSQKALQYYERELGVIKKTEAQDGVRSSKHQSTYRGGFQ